MQSQKINPFIRTMTPHELDQSNYKGVFDNSVNNLQNS